MRFFVPLQAETIGGKMFVKSRALVLHTFKYNDAASVSVLFTEEKGPVSFLVRVPKTRRGSGRHKLFRQLNVLEIEWEPHESRSLQHVRNVCAIYTYAAIPFDPDKMAISMFIGDFLYHSLKGEHAGRPLFEYLFSSLQWLDAASSSFANFHLVFLIRLSRFLGFLPNVSDYVPHSSFDLLNSCFTLSPTVHSHLLGEAEAAGIPLLLRMNYDTMHLFHFSREERNRLLDVINEYYRLHIPDFPKLKSLEVLRQLYEKP